MDAKKEAVREYPKRPVVRSVSAAKSVSDSLAYSGGRMDREKSADVDAVLTLEEAERAKRIPGLLGRPSK
jgi:hypothetical protein